MIRLARPDLDDADIEAVVAVLRSGALVQGQQVAQFEAAVAALVGVEHVIAVTNCTAALQLALLGLGIGPGDVVAVAAYSWISTANVVELCGATPRFVDIDPVTHNLDPTALEAVLAGGSVQAVLPVHTFGRIADMPSIMAVADAAGVPVIEDAACALGAELDGVQAGAWGRAGCFSFHPRKAITTGEGGAIATDDGELADVLRSLRNHGQDPAADTVRFVRAGFNCRMTEMQAAMGVTQMARVDRIIEGRRALVDRYRPLLHGSGCVLPEPPTAAEHVYQSFVVLLPADLAGRNAEVIAGLRSRGVEATIGTYHMPLTDHFRSVQHVAPGDYPNADDVAGRAVTLPLWNGLSEDDQACVATTLRTVIAELG